MWRNLKCLFLYESRRPKMTNILCGSNYITLGENKTMKRPKKQWFPGTRKPGGVK